MDTETSAGAQQRRELDAIHKASVQLHRLRDPASLARDVITLLKDVVHHDFAAVYLVDGERLKTFAVSDRGLGKDVIEADQAYLDSLDLRVGQNITGWVAEHGEAVRLDDVTSDSRYLHSQENIHSELCVPMWSGGHVFGVVNLESTRQNAYAESDQRVLETVANQIAIAIENGQLLARAQEMLRLRTVADLTGGIAHDLGNLLVAASLHCDALRSESSLEAGELQQLSAVQNILDKAITLTRSLLQIGLPATAAREPMDLNQHLRDLLPLLEAVCGQAMSVELETCEGSAPITAARGEIDQILINLAVNSRQASGPSGYLGIRTQIMQGVTPAAIVVEVLDDGAGMSPDTLATATEPSFTTRKEGSGLGLATVARLVDELGGELRLFSEPDRGTRVRIALPFHGPEFDCPVVG